MTPQRREGIAHVRYGRDKSVTVGSAVRPGGPHADVWGARVWGEKLQSEAQRMRVSGRDCVELRGGYGHFPTGPTEGKVGAMECLGVRGTPPKLFLIYWHIFYDLLKN